jgi:TolA-binding protein
MRDMDVKGLIEVLTRNLIALVVVVIAFAGGVYYLIDGFRDLADKRQGLSEQIQAFEIAKSNFKVEQVEKEYELNARLAQVAHREEEADKRSDDLESRDKVYSKALSDLQRQGETLSKEQKSKDAQDKIEHLITQFADLGVNLYDNPMCSDKDGVRRYNSAKAIFSTINSLARQNFMTGRYSEFINKHRGRDYIDCR